MNVPELLFGYPSIQLKQKEWKKTVKQNLKKSSTTCSFSIAETLFESINQQLIKEGISSQQCVSLGLDNTNANIGTICLTTLAEKLYNHR